MASLNEQWGGSLPRPTVLSGDVTAANLGLSLTDRFWLSRRCTSVLHAAACVGFRAATDGEPWKTNVEGARRLVHLCARMGTAEVHHISTAFVCGDRTGPVGEDELEKGQGFHNEYERSKYEAERLLRQRADCTSQSIAPPSSWATAAADLPAPITASIASSTSPTAWPALHRRAGAPFPCVCPSPVTSRATSFPWTGWRRLSRASSLSRASTGERIISRPRTPCRPGGSRTSAKRCWALRE